MELSKQEMELFLLLSDLQSKDLFYKKFLPFKNESKLVLKTGNGIISSLLLMCSDVLTGVGTPHKFLRQDRRVVWWVGGWWVSRCIIMPLCGSILQDWTCLIFSKAENPRRSRVWQYIFSEKTAIFTEIVELFKFVQFRYLDKLALALTQTT